MKTRKHNVKQIISFIYNTIEPQLFGHVIMLNLQQSESRTETLLIDSSPADRQSAALFTVCALCRSRPQRQRQNIITCWYSSSFPGFGPLFPPSGPDDAYVRRHNSQSTSLMLAWCAPLSPKVSVNCALENDCRVDRQDLILLLDNWRKWAGNGQHATSGQSALSLWKSLVMLNALMNWARQLFNALALT